MARKKITEFRAKTLLIPHYSGIHIDPSVDISSLLKENQDDQSYVVKVDQGIKGRMKKGLVLLPIKKEGIINALENLKEKGYESFLIEPLLAHEQADERYFSLSREREGIICITSERGGIDIESHPESLKKMLITDDSDLSEVAHTLSLPEEFLKTIVHAFHEYGMTFIEMNPLITYHNSLVPLDIACEVDDTMELLVHNAWSSDDFPLLQTKTEEEQNIDILKTKSSASFAFTPLHLNGGIFMLLSGGGVSIVLADEVYNLGYGNELANYGEYSGNPNAEETYIYTKNVLSLLIKSQAKKKVLLIGGGVANFTDIAKTFTGVINALQEVSHALREQHIKIFVRRGGPNQTEGLAHMKSFLEKEGLLGAVCGPDVPLPDIVKMMVKELA